MQTVEKQQVRRHPSDNFVWVALALGLLAGAAALTVGVTALFALIITIGVAGWTWAVAGWVARLRRN